MKIEVKEKGTKEMYKEVVNIGMQYRGLMKRPGAVLNDNFKSYRNYLILLLCLLAINIITGVRSGFSTIVIVALAIVSVATLFTAAVLIRMNLQVKNYLADERATTVTLDKKGVEMNKEGTQVVRLSWDNVAFVRAFKETTTFFAKDTQGLYFSVTNAYRKRILDHLKKENVPVQYIK